MPRCWLIFLKGFSMFSDRLFRQFLPVSCLIGFVCYVSLPWLLFAQESQASSQSIQGQVTSGPTTQSSPVAAPAQSNQLLVTPHLGGEPIQVIYIVPMRNKMEKYLARELTKWGRFQVTLKPKDANALLSDSPAINVEDILQAKTAAIRTNEGNPGNMFLISCQTEKILWATREKASSLNPLAGPKTLDGLAEGIIGNLRHDVNEWDKKMKKEEAAQIKP
jgi:hypothetical protein